MAVAIAAARAHAAAGPAVNPLAAASAAKSAAACARCRDTIAEPRVNPTAATRVRAATIAAASTVAAPASSVARFGRRDCLPRDDDTGQYR